jgi:hypothetical protein
LENVFFPLANKNTLPFRPFRILAALLLMAAGCASALGAPRLDQIITPADLAAAQDRALRLNRPLLVLVVESGGSRADDEAIDAFKSRSVRQNSDGKVCLAITDLSASEVRATAARFHPLETPLLVCLSPRGIILSRSRKPINGELITEKMRDAGDESLLTDQKLEVLEKAVGNNGSDTAARLALADFLMERQNAFEAIPVLTALAHSKDVPAPLRIRVWADLVRAHFWIAEPEKARREASDMVAELGTANPEARAAANLMLGNQDATNPKRIERARQEFEEAVSAAPESVYGKLAAVALADLPKGSP